jgi:ankyrin repeat protein
VVRGTVVHVNKEESPHLAPHLEEEDRGLPLLASTLVEAAEKGDRKTVDYLLRAGISPNVAVHGDGSPLIAAARSGRSDLVQHLLARGANIDGGVDGDGNPLIVAAAAGHYNIVRLLLDRGADIEAIVPSDENALMQAAYHGHEDVVRLLIARGANVNSRDGSRTPLNMARAGGDDAIVRLLLDAGARQ